MVNGLPDFGDYKEIMHPCPSIELSTKKRISVKIHKRNFYGKAVAARQLESPISVLKRRSFKLKESDLLL
ncbi:hypothetical protein OAE99_00105 [bacterium]|nr:hypothetical protein [bacterium]MDC0308906.1 hypothetical protein [bacterium]